MNILYLADSLGNGGAERQLALLLKYLPQEWQRRVFSLGEGPFVRAIRSNGIKVDICERKTQFDPRPALPLWRLIRDWEPDLIHSWGWMSTIAAIPICKAKRIPLIDGTIRMGMRPPRGALWQWLALSVAEGVIANSKAGLEAWNISRSKGRVIYNGFDFERIRYCHPEANYDTGPYLIGMVGRMSFEKDYSSFISAAQHIVQNAQADINFVALGDGNQRQKLIQKAKPLMDVGRFHFPDPTMEAMPIVNQLNVGVLMSHPSLHAEGCSNAIMEYMACGLPVICSTGGGNSELVLEGKTGFLIQPGDWNTLADKVLYLYDHIDIAKQMGDEGRRRLIENFSIEKMIDETANFYVQLIDKMRRS